MNPNTLLSKLSDKMINDYLDIQSGEVIDMGLEIDLAVNKNESQSDIMQTVIQDVTTYFDFNKRKMGDPLLVGGLHKIIASVSGVENVIDIRVYNLIGGQYSSAETSMAYADAETKLIQSVDDTIFAQPSQVYQIRYPGKDIRISVKNFQNVSFS